MRRAGASESSFASEMNALMVPVLFQHPLKNPEKFFPGSVYPSEAFRTPPSLLWTPCWHRALGDVRVVDEGPGLSLRHCRRGRRAAAGRQQHKQQRIKR